MNLRSIDLNLLVIFDALISERNVTRAAMKIPMSQPAMSNALTRLRFLFKDPLFVRTASGMEPTPRALELSESVRQILRQTQRLMSTEVGFDPSNDDRSFTARMSDLIAFLVLPLALMQLHLQAPGITLDVLNLCPDGTLKALDDDELDFGLSMELRHTNAICSEPLFTDQMVCVMRADHPLAHKQLTMDQFLAADHVRVAASPTDKAFVDNVLADSGHARRVVSSVPHWLLVPEILRHTNTVSVISSKLAARFSNENIITKPLPFASVPFTWNIYWHRRHHASMSHRWIRNMIQGCCAQL